MVVGPSWAQKALWTDRTRPSIHQLFSYRFMLLTKCLLLLLLLLLIIIITYLSAISVCFVQQIIDVCSNVRVTKLAHTNTSKTVHYHGHPVTLVC